MCRRCGCPEICNCNTSCFFGFKIPLGVGYSFCSIWLLFNGIGFPLISFVFWPKYYILYASYCICVVNSCFSFISFVNMKLKNRVLLKTVLYGVLTTYLAGGLFIILAVNIDIGDNKRLLIDSFRRKFDVSLPPPIAFEILQSTQIVFFAYLFIAYVYCGFVLQLYDIEHDKWYRRGPNVYD